MINFWLKTISILEITGGIFGIVFLIWWVVISPFNIDAFLLVPLLITIYVLSILGGFWLWKGKRYGRPASVIIQAIQVPKIISPFVIFMFSFGFDSWIQFLILNNGFTSLGFEFRFLFFSQLFFNNQNVPTGIGVSITSLLFLFLLLNYQPEIMVSEKESTPPLPPSFEQNADKSDNLKGA